MNTARVSVIVFLFMAVTTSGSWAQLSQSEPVACSELQALTNSIDRLVTTLAESREREAQYQQLELAVAYLQFRFRRIEDLETEVRRAEDQRADSLESVERMSAEVQHFEDQLEGASGREAEQLENALKLYRLRHKAVKEELERLELRAVDLQNEVNDARRQVLAIEEYVLEHLNLEP